MNRPSVMVTLTVMQWIDGVYHELEQSVPEVAPGVQDGNVGGSPTRVLARHHAGHGRAGHARLGREGARIYTGSPPPNPSGRRGKER